MEKSGKDCWNGPSAPPSYDEACGGGWVGAGGGGYPGPYGAGGGQQASWAPNSAVVPPGFAPAPAPAFAPAPSPAMAGSGGPGMLPYPVQNQGPLQYFPANPGPQQPAGYYPGAAPPGFGGQGSFQPGGPQNWTLPAAPGAFDAGARFGPYSPQTIPPPPPGVAPNAAQLAMMNGKGVPKEAPKQKKGGFFNGTGSGGYSFW